jgi:YVTN family beta-propeller protein
VQEFWGSVRWKRVALLLLCGLVLACSGTTGPAPEPIPPHGPATYHTGVNPVGVAVAGGYAWVANAGEGTVSRIDLRNDRTLARVQIGDAVRYGKPCEAKNIHQTPHGSFGIRQCDVPRGLALGPHALWVIANDTLSLLRIDPGSGRVVARIPIGVNGWYVAASDSAVWVTAYDTQTIVRVDPRTDQVVATIRDVPLGPTGIVLSGDAVWVACSRADVVIRIDPGTNRVAATIPVGHTPLPVASGFGSVWVRNESSELAGTVSRIDPATDQVVATIPIGMEMGRDGLDGLAVTGGGVWVAGLDLAEIDPATNRVARKINHMCNAAIAADGALWTIDIAYSITRFRV